MLHEDASARMNRNAVLQQVVTKELKDRVQKGPEVGIRSRRLAY